MRVHVLSEQLYSEIAELAAEQALNGVWAYFDAREVKKAGVDAWGFQCRREMFLCVIARLMREGRLRLAKHGRFLEGDIEEQIEQFREAFPESDEAVDMGGAGVWFFTEECPGGAVWIQEDGSEVWT